MTVAPIRDLTPYEAVIIARDGFRIWNESRMPGGHNLLHCIRAKT